MALPAPRVILFQDVEGKWRFHRQARNGRTTAPSQAYEYRSSAVEEARKEFPDLDIIDRPRV